MLSMKHSATCFYNSYFMESSTHRLESLKDGPAFIIPLSNSELIIPIKRYSKLGRHEYIGTFILKEKEGPETISFEQSITLLNLHLSQNTALAKRVMDSLRNIQTSLKNRKEDFLQLYNEPASFQQSEQALFVGHAFHPAPKSREGFSDEDSKTYSPESGGRFPLRWFWLANDCLYQNHSEYFQDHDWIKKLCQREFPNLQQKEGFIPFPIHPWQYRWLLEHPDFREYLALGKLIEIRQRGQDWYATTSLRTLFNKEAPYMLKFSLNVKLTNSVRHLLEHELIRGLQVHDVFFSQEGKKFQAKEKSFQVIFEPVYMGIKDAQGRPIKESFVMARENPYQYSHGQHITLAVLTQDHPEFKTNLIQEQIQNYAEQTKLTFQESSLIWFKRFLEVSILPLLRAQANFGILLGAHQQNLILTIENNLPTRGHFRDCHGTGYSPLGYELFGEEVSRLRPENGNILSHETGNYLFSYYLIINSVFNTITAICRDGKQAEEDVIQVFRNEMLKMKQEGLRDISCLDYLLNQKFLMLKGNFLCSLKNINENTATNPLDIYLPIKNPFHHSGNIQMATLETTYSPLSIDDEFKARIEGNHLFIKSRKDFHLEAMFIQNDETIELTVLNHNAGEGPMDIIHIGMEHLFGQYTNCLNINYAGTSMNRSEFFQMPKLWTRNTASVVTPEKWTQTNGLNHPVRKPLPSGYFYKKHVHQINKTLGLRLITEEDLDTFHNWHNQPRVSFFWELQKPKEELLTYIQKGLKDPHQVPVIVELDGEKVGYFEFYWVLEDRLGPYYDCEAFDRGFHFLVGNKNFLGHVNTDSIIKSVLHFLFLDDPRTRKIMAEPRHDNQKVLKYAEASIGWKKLKEFDFPHKRAALLACRRELFFGGHAL